MSLYGSCLWDLFSEKCERLYKAWNVSVRIALNVSRYTHRYLIEPVSKTLHPKVILCSRFVKFHNTLQAHSSKPAVKFLSKICTNDLRTTYGSNLYKISKACNVQVADLNPSEVKQCMPYMKIPLEEKWRVPVITDLLLVKNDEFTLSNLDQNEIDEILFHACTS